MHLAAAISERFSGQCVYWLGALILLSAVWWLTPAAARADCGDYVMIGHPATGHDSMPASHADKSRPDQPKPCSGPTCSRKPIAPAPVAPSTSWQPPAGEWATLIGPDEHDPLTAQTLPISPGWLAPQAQPADIFHPPRGR
jgi:hypothetical protein